MEAASPSPLHRYGHSPCNDEEFPPAVRATHVCVQAAPLDCNRLLRIHIDDDSDGEKCEAGDAKRPPSAPASDKRGSFMESFVPRSPSASTESPARHDEKEDIRDFPEEAADTDSAAAKATQPKRLRLKMQKGEDASDSGEFLPRSPTPPSETRETATKSEREPSTPKPERPLWRRDRPSDSSEASEDDRSSQSSASLSSSSSGSESSDLEDEEGPLSPLGRPGGASAQRRWITSPSTEGEFQEALDWCLSYIEKDGHTFATTATKEQRRLEIALWDDELTRGGTRSFADAFFCDPQRALSAQHLPATTPEEKAIVFLDFPNEVYQTEFLHL
ncbi:uncharacterized protein LOC113147035 [Cyclospora cayetanensis]|uniref:Uncharacterized protein LOC113147035 n=1 Tax=Cyclospora cayetanensis TaxID=88456 RepID=A0A6P6RVP6_9EIME|nr:uncharacterized protein LOC113147035 [Cyclospora cayetanensis]